MTNFPDFNAGSISFSMWKYLSAAAMQARHLPRYDSSPIFKNSPREDLVGSFVRKTSNPNTINFFAKAAMIVVLPTPF